MTAFAAVESALRRGDPAALDPAAFPPCVAAAVTLRFQHEAFGYGTAFSLEAGGSADAVPTAARTALERATPGLPAQDAEEFRVIGRDFTISLELVSELTPLDAGGSWGQLLDGLSPGADALAVRAGGRFRVYFPEFMLERKLDPLSAFQGLVRDVVGPQAIIEENAKELRFREPAELADQFGVVFYRARTTHIVGFPSYANVAPTFGERAQGARFMTRGGLVEPISGIPGELGSFADGIARHLRERLWAGSGPTRLVGSIQPDGSAVPTIAPIAEQAGAAYALLVYSHTSGVDPRRVQVSRELAFALLAGLESVEAGDVQPADEPACAALCVLAICEAGEVPPEVAIRYAKLWSACSGALRGAYDRQGGFAQGVPPTAKGLIALAIAELAKVEKDAALGALSADATKAAFQQTSPELLIGQMPWLLWAEAANREAASFVVPLREMRALVRAHQVTSDSAGPDNADLVGGFVFTSTGVPVPTWHSARAVVTLASMLEDPALTSREPAELGPEFVALRRSLRFLRQLGVDATDSYLYRSPGTVTGGVRAAPWNIELPLDASTMTLLAVCRSMRAIEEINR